MPDPHALQTASQFCILTSLRWDPILDGHPDCAYGNLFYLLDFHRLRLLSSVKCFNEDGTAAEGRGKWGSVLAWLEEKTAFENEMQSEVRSSGVCLNGPVRVRVTLPIPQNSETSPAHRNFNLTITQIPHVPISTLFPSALPRPLKPLPSPEDWMLHVDTEATIPSRLTRHKTTERSIYEACRERCSLPPLGVPGSKHEVIIYNNHEEVMEGGFTSLYFLRHGEWITPSLTCGGCEATSRRWLLEKGIVKEGIVKKNDIEIGEWVVMSNGVRGVWGGWV
ncbi:aminotransferase, partial [Kalaharituber pfeilii]